MKPNDTVQAIVSFLRDNLYDPKDKRRNEDRNWIFSDEPKFSATMPRIMVQTIDGEMTPLGIGTTAREQRLRIQISIFLNKKGKYDVDNDDTAESSNEAINYIADQVINKIEKNQDSIITNTDLLYIYPTMERGPTLNEGVYQTDIDVEGIMIRR